MDKKKFDAVQELKAERVQEELMAAVEPDRMVISLKAERVQGPAFAAAEKPLPVFFEVAVSQRQPVSIELRTLQIVVTLHGTAAGDGTAGPAQAPGLGKAW